MLSLSGGEQLFSLSFETQSQTIPTEMVWFFWDLSWRPSQELDRLDMRRLDEASRIIIIIIVVVVVIISNARNMMIIIIVVKSR